MKLNKREGSLSIIEMAIMAVAVVAAAVVVFIVVNRQETGSITNGAAQTSDVSSPNDVPSAPEIKSVEDLDKASQTLDDVNLDAADETSQLDAELNAF